MNWTVLTNLANFFQGIVGLSLDLGKASLWRKLQLKWRGPKPPSRFV
jgi:hypothetical protein